MNKSQAINLFQLQTEMIDTKVDMAVSRTIDRVIGQLNGLRDDIHSLKDDMNNRFSSMEQRFSSIEQRLIAVETKLGMVNERQREVRTKFIDYSFRAGWLALGASLSYFIVQLHALIK